MREKLGVQLIVGMYAIKATDFLAVPPVFAHDFRAADIAAFLGDLRRPANRNVSGTNGVMWLEARSQSR